MDAIRKQAKAFREQVARQQQVFLIPILLSFIKRFLFTA
jgi:hypothetical protein